MPFSDAPTRPVPARRPARPREPEPPTRPVPRTPAREPREPREPRKPAVVTRPRPPTPDQPGAEQKVAEKKTTEPAGTSHRARREGRSPRSLGSALLTTAAATVAPGAGHLMLARRRTGAAILGVFLLIVAALVAIALNVRQSDLLGKLLSTDVLVWGAIGCIAAALAWMAVIVRTYLLARPKGLDTGRQAVGVAVVAALCLVVAAPLGFGANLANSQRNLLNSLFAGGGGTAAAEAIAKPRLNVLLVGSDAGPDRAGARTDTMMVASIDTRTGRTILFGLPRNIGYAQFPPDSPMAEEFPRGFHDPSDPTSGDYLLNAIYAYGLAYPELAPEGPTADPGLNLLHQTVSYMLGLQLDYYVEVNMAGFASIIDAMGGLTVDVGPDRIPIGGITPSGRLVEPDRYIEPGVQQLSGEDALAFARSRTGTTDYARMGRQRCLLQNILNQASPTDLLANFQQIAAATTNTVATNIPQEVLPALASLASDADGLSLESIAFDPNLPDPEEPDGRFDTGRPNFPYMREVVQDAVNRPAAPAPATAAPAAPEAPTEPRAAPGTDTDTGSGTGTGDEAPPADQAAPESLAASC
ncbi:LCP family protein [Pseudonocardia nigra]|uniref:LCP family protein n=1 Tax=Pseudonocardia nigra TaxID=1921578 RepID=UPI001C5FD719|nr:LCP family protein [Pseudonocardia nigra]